LTSLSATEIIDFILLPKCELAAERSTFWRRRRRRRRTLILPLSHLVSQSECWQRQERQAGRQAGRKEGRKEGRKAGSPAGPRRQNAASSSRQSVVRQAVCRTDTFWAESINAIVSQHLGRHSPICLESCHDFNFRTSLYVLSIKTRLKSLINHNPRG
jgi:hypothetical protein